MISLVQASNDTVTVVPNIVMEASSIWPSLVLTGLTLVVLIGQLWVYNRQREIMERQTTISNDQHRLSEEHARWRRDEAIGTFYRLSLDLMSEFKKADVAVGDKVVPDYNTHPRQVLREASRVFAPLGNSAIMALNQAGVVLDQYFSAVLEYGVSVDRAKGNLTLQQERWNSVQSLRGLVGSNLDLANRQIPADLQWHPAEGRDYDFRALSLKPNTGREWQRVPASDG